MNNRILILLSAASLALCGQGAGYPSDLVYYSKLDSAADITTPQVGEGGTVASTSFVPGVKGSAVNVADGSVKIQLPFKQGLPIGRGCIEFWAKIVNNRSSYVVADSEFIFFLKGGSTVGNFYIGANNGVAQHGFVCNFPALASLASFPGFSSEYPYSTIFGEKDPKAWHHHAIVWNTNGIEGTTHIVRTYLDGVVTMSADGSGGDYSGYADYHKGEMTLALGGGNSAVQFDEFRVWSTDRTTFPEGPITPEQDSVVVSDVTAKQHYPWCGKIDIGYTVAGATDGLLVKITVRDNDNDVTYEAKTFDTAPTAAVGTHTVVWDATKDGVNKVSKNMVATVSLIVPEN